MNDIHETLKNRLLDYIESVTTKTKTKNQYVCPLCGSGTGVNHTGAFTYYPKTNSFYCFSCQIGGDIFKLHAELNELDNQRDFTQIVRELKQMFSIPSNSYSAPKKKSTTVKSTSLQPETAEKNFSKLFESAEQHLHETDYLTKRGISPEIQRKFHCGYVPSFIYKNNQTTSAIIIPTSKGSYAWRSTTENIKQKRGTTHILNPDALKSPYCFVVEGEIDCMSVTECGFACIGLGSTSNIEKIFGYDTSETVLIIAMDNDSAGIKASRKLEQLCIEHQTPYITASESIWSDCKDANELLMKDRQTLTDKLEDVRNIAISFDKDEWYRQTQEHSKDNFDWHDRLTYNDANNGLKNCLNNICLILENDEEYKGKIEFNELTQMRSFCRNYWTDTIDSYIKLFLERKYNIITSVDNINHACNIIGEEHRYHPIKEYLQSVKWDGIPRLESVFSDFLGATDNKYTRAVAAISFIGAVARIYQPGVKFDTCTVFVGPQGVGKSKFIYKIAHNPDWFSDSITTFDGKEFFDGILGRWIIELGEGTAFQKSVKERCKQALASQQDVYRRPYARHSEVQKRQCVFFGTTNNYDFLKDETGDRRFYPIDVIPNKATKSIDTDLTSEYIGQLWAEAVILYQNGQNIYIQDKEILEIAGREQQKHFDESPLQADIYNFMEMLVPKNWYSMTLESRRNYIRNYQNGNTSAGAYRRDRVSVKEIVCELYKYELAQIIERKTSLEIARALIALGWYKNGKIERLNIYGHQRMFYK